MLDIETDYTAAAGRGHPIPPRVAPDYHIDRGVIVANAGPERVYFPMSGNHPGIAGELGKLQFGDEEKALAFARRWGLLGYPDALQAAATQGHRIPNAWGDPLPWVWGHANGVRAILDALGALNRPSDGDLNGLLESWRVSRNETTMAAHLTLGKRLHRGSVRDLVTVAAPLFDPPARPDSRFYSLVYGQRHLIKATYWNRNTGRDARASARTIIGEIINANLEGVSIGVQVGDDGAAFGMRWRALIGAVYLQLARAAVSAAIALCEYCGSPFISTDKRERFCPSRDPFVAKSHCGAMSRHARRKGDPK